MTDAAPSPAPRGAGRPDDPPVGSVDRALRLIELLSHHARGLTLEETALAAGWPRSSTHRLLSALRHRGFAMQPEPNGRYFLGPAVLESAFRFHDGMELRQLLHPELVRLNARFNETVHLGVLTGSEIVYIDKIEANRPVKLSSTIGGRNPAHCTGLGKALLAWTLTDQDALTDWIVRHGPLVRRTSSTIVEPRELWAELEAIRGRGHSLDLGENEVDVNCVAVPIFLGSRRPVAALSIAGPRSRLGTAELGEIATDMREHVTSARVPDQGG